MSYRSNTTRSNGNQEISFLNSGSQFSPSLSRQEKQPSITKAPDSTKSRQEKQLSRNKAVAQTKKFVPPLSSRATGRLAATISSTINFPPHLEPSIFSLSNKRKNPTRSQPLEVSQTLNKSRTPLSSTTLPQSIEEPLNLPEETNEVQDDGGEEDDVAEVNVEEHVVDPSKSNPKPKRARTMKTLEWTGPQNVDEKEDVLIMDSENNQKILSGTIRPIDIDSLEDGVKLVVVFNDFNQPLRRGGAALVSYLGYLAKIERYCPIGVLNWRKLDDTFKRSIKNKVRGKFIIPPGELFDKAILSRVNKQWKQYKFTLKDAKFNPDKRTKDQIVEDVPYGHSPHSWSSLVNYWYTDESKKYSRVGKVARAAQSHVHTTGRVSFANKHADVVESTGKCPSQLEFFKLTHTKIGGGFVKNTSSSQLLEEANSKVDEQLNNASSSKSRTEIENDVFEQLIYDENSKRPFGYGYGVKKSQVLGAHAIVRTEGHKSASTTNNSVEIDLIKAKMSTMNEENQAIRKENQELLSMISQSNKILHQTIQAIRIGNVSSEICDSLQSALRVPTSEVPSGANDNIIRNGSDVLPSTTTPI